MAEHTTFKTGGPADLWIRPEGECFPDFSALLLETARNEGIPVFVLGAGANIVVSDQGIRGIVLDTTGYSGEVGSGEWGIGNREQGAGDELPSGSIEKIPQSPLCFRAGTAVDDAVEIAAARGLSGLEFLAGMPGSIGGALWMNARCYDREMADTVCGVQYLEKGKIICEVPPKEAFSHKKSPYQEKKCLILSVLFAMQKKDTLFIKNEMETHRKDREAKGHYRFPSAGSVFRNNRLFGKPTGKIIDELGLKGLAVGDAQVAPWHGNIIINSGKAQSKDILALVELLEMRVKSELSIDLEREIIFIGNY